jgi:PBSX family phage terminase large subunit
VYEIQLTEKQAEYVREATRRWNFAVGAVRSGKSHLAVRHTIPDRLLAGHGMRGINLIMGVSKESIERNVLTPMRDIWGDRMVSDINTRNWATVFGERVYCIGAEKVSQVSKLRGSEVKFAYLDEICDIHPEVFEMLKSRLSLEYSECHGACNPAGPSHYVKQFIDQALAPESGIDLFYQHYTIYDNPFLPQAYVRSLEAEYAGTVYYKRYIDGLWAQAEGLVYPMWEQALEDPWDPFLRDQEGQVVRNSQDVPLCRATDWCVSVDYGTMNAFAALLWARSPDGTWHCVEEYVYSGRDEGHLKTDDDYVRDLVALCSYVPGEPQVIVDPSAASFIEALRRCRERTFRVLPADNAVLDGIRDVAVCLQTGRIRISRRLEGICREFPGYVWEDSAGDDRPRKVDDHCMDSMRYFVKTRRVYRPQEPYTSPLERYRR